MTLADLQFFPYGMLGELLNSNCLVLWSVVLKHVFLFFQYAEKVFVHNSKADLSCLLIAQQMWDGVRTNNKKAVYQHIVTSNADVNAVYGQSSFNSSLTLAKAMLLQEHSTTILDRSSSFIIGNSQLRASSMSSCSPATIIEEINKTDECFEGGSLLHLACQTADIGMIELLLQYGANVNATDLQDRTPLHHCVLKGRHSFAKLLLSR